MSPSLTSPAYAVDDMGQPLFIRARLAAPEDGFVSSKVDELDIAVD